MLKPSDMTLDELHLAQALLVTESERMRSKLMDIKMEVYRRKNPDYKNKIVYRNNTPIDPQKDKR